MTKIDALISALNARAISKDEFIKEYFKEIPISNEYVLKIIEKGISGQDAAVIEEAVALLYTGYFSIVLFADKLGELLRLPWHTKHEDIAMLLKDVADPRTVDYLYQATELAFDYLDYDDTYQFSRKCIKALSAIGNEAAIDKLKLLAHSRVPEIANYARKELIYKGLLP